MFLVKYCPCTTVGESMFKVKSCQVFRFCSWFGVNKLHLVLQACLQWTKLHMTVSCEFEVKVFCLILFILLDQCLILPSLFCFVPPVLYFLPTPLPHLVVLLLSPPSWALVDLTLLLHLLYLLHHNCYSLLLLHLGFSCVELLSTLLYLLWRSCNHFFPYILSSFFLAHLTTTLITFVFVLFFFV